MPQQTHAQLTRGILAVLAASPDINKTPEELVELLVAGGHKMAKDKPSRHASASSIRGGRAQVNQEGRRETLHRATTIKDGIYPCIIGEAPSTATEKKK